MTKAAASSKAKPFGSGITPAAATQAWVAKPPLEPIAATASPTLRCVTPSPTASTTPAYSEPGTKGSGGLNWYLFCTVSRSGKFRLAALIAISTSPALGTGVGSSFHCSASTPVGFSQSHACMSGLVVREGRA
jgi:hypothetical protein